MMKKIIFITLFLILTVGSSRGYAKLKKNLKTPDSFYKVKQVLRELNQNDLQELMHEFIYSSGPGRFVGSKGHQKASPFILDYLRKWNYKGESLIKVEDFIPDVETAINSYQNDFTNKIE